MLSENLEAWAGTEIEKFVKQPAASTAESNDPEIILVEYDENDPENPLNWTSSRKWLIVFAVSWMGFVSVFATMTIVPTAPQILQEFHSHSVFKRTLIVTIWELGEGIGPFFIAPLSERFGRLPVFHVGNLLALCCLVASALSVNIPMLIVFRLLTGSFLSILTLGPAIVGDLFLMQESGRAMAFAMGAQLLADFISPIAGAYIAQSLGWRWSIWLAVIALGTFSLLLLIVLRETYAVIILRRKARRLQSENPGTTYQSKHQVRINASTILENALKPMWILVQSPILMLTTAFTAVIYGLASLVFSTLTETMESTYPSVFSRGSIGLTFLSLAVGSTAALLFYSLTSDRYIIYKQKTNGDAFRPESRLTYLLLAALIVAVGFLIYGWTLAFHIHYIVPLLGTCAVGFGMIISLLATETYIVDVYKTYGASAIAGGVIVRAITGAVLPLMGPPLYQGIRYGWGNSVLALIAVLFVPFLGFLIRRGDWFRDRERLGPRGR